MVALLKLGNSSRLLTVRLSFAMICWGRSGWRMDS